MKREVKFVMSLAAAIFAAGVLHAQQPSAGKRTPESQELPDSSLWQRFERAMAGHTGPNGQLRPIGTYLAGELDPEDFIPPQHNRTSYILSPRMPAHVNVTGPWHITPRWSISVTNGNASNWEIDWGIQPSAYLDARTLSFPIPR